MITISYGSLNDLETSIKQQKKLIKDQTVNNNFFAFLSFLFFFGFSLISKEQEQEIKEKQMINTKQETRRSCFKVNENSK